MPRIEAIPRAEMVKNSFLVTSFFNNGSKGFMVYSLSVVALIGVALICVVNASVMI